MTLFITTWHWGKKYGPEYIERLRLGVEKWHRKPYEWRVFKPEPHDVHLTDLPGCLCRLRMFDREWQERQGIQRGDRIVCMDLDSIVTGPIEPFFERDDRFLILRGANSENPNPFNGSLMMLKAGYHEDVWTKFNLEDLHAKARWHHYPDDQAWIWHMLPESSGWKAGFGIFAFKKPGWPRGDDLPRDARLIVFPGWRDPSQFTHLPWVQQHWVSLAATGPRHN